MRVVPLGSPASGSEERFAKALGHLRQPGIAWTNLIVPGRRHRELDGLLVLAGGLVVVEVKGTDEAGTIQPRVNGPWEITAPDGTARPITFAGARNPDRQCGENAKILASFLEQVGIDAGFVSCLVFVDGPSAHCPAAEIPGGFACDESGLTQCLERLAREASRRPGFGEISITTIGAVAGALGITLGDSERLEASAFTESWGDGTTAEAVVGSPENGSEEGVNDHRKR